MAGTIEQIRAEYDSSGGRDFHAEGRFAVVNCTYRDGRNGRFAVVELRDGTGSLTARCFDSVIADGLATAGAVDARLKIGEFNGAISAVLNAYDVAELGADDVLRLAGLDVDVHQRRVEQLETWLAECDGTEYGTVVRACLRAAGTWQQFCMAPAAVRMHHAEPGGLVRHLVEVGRGGLALLDTIDEPYDRAYFLAGVFLHDIGKLDTYTEPPTIAYTAHGQLGEHQIWSTFRTAKACAEVGASPYVEARLVHIIEQAHGSHRHAEWQDPVGPEVKALAAADLFSSRLGATDKELRARGLLDAVPRDAAVMHAEQPSTPTGAPALFE